MHKARAAPGLRPRRGSQHGMTALPASRSPAAPGLRPWRGSQLRRGGTAARRQRRGFGPGEDHNTLERRASAQGDMAAPGLRPWRGSQLSRHRPNGSDRRQRRDSALARITTPAAHGPVPGHRGSAGTSALARITTAEIGPSCRWDGRSAGASALARITTALGGADRQGAGSAGASALARITTPPTSRPGDEVAAAPGLRPWRGSQHPEHRRHAAARMLAAASVLLAG